MSEDPLDPALVPPAEPSTRRARLHPAPASRRVLLGALAGGAVAVAGGGYAAHHGSSGTAPTGLAGPAPATVPGRGAPAGAGPASRVAAPSPAPAASPSPSASAAPRPRPRAATPITPPPASVKTYPPTGQGVAGGAPPPLAHVVPTQARTILPLDQSAHLVRRATWGVVPADLAAAKSLGADAWLTRQLSTTAPSEPVLGPVLAAFTTLGKTSAQVRAMTDGSDDDYFMAHGELELAAIARAMWSNRQLYEVLVDFFHSRVHVPVYTDKSRFTLTSYDATVVRRYALGSYADMVWASVTHPAMLSYLDNTENTRWGGNQNLGRELLELHTVGVDAGYTQADVEAAATLLTGVGVDDATLTMRYTPSDHATGAVTVMGVRYPNSSAADGLTTLRTLITNLTHNRHTAISLATDLARRFVSDAPPGPLVARLAQIYLNTGTAITPMVRALFGSAEFAASVGAKYRRPLENFVATARALGVAPNGPVSDTVSSLDWMRWEMYNLGQNPLGHNAPDGHPDFARPWLSTSGTLGRWNLAMVLSGGWATGFTPPAVATWLAPTKTFGEAVDAIASATLHQPLTADMRSAVLGFLGKAAGTTMRSWEKTGYQLVAQVPAIIASGPHLQVR